MATINQVHEAHQNGEIHAGHWYTDKIIHLEELCEVSQHETKKIFMVALERVQVLCRWHREIYPEDFEG